jgi:ADP-ribose pyrophosphatase
VAYENRWIKVREDTVELPNGQTTLYSVVECSGAVGVLPFLDDERVVLVRQYRYVFDDNQRWEIPTGGLHPGEALEAAARRELREEIGYEPAQLSPLPSFYSSKSVMYEVCHLFVGRELSPAVAPPDDTEFIEVGVFPFVEVLKMVQAGEIRDAMTVIAVLQAALLQGMAGRAPG